MPGSQSVEEIASAIEQLDQTQREALLLRMAKIDGLLEELEDMADVIRAQREPSKPFDDFLAELRVESLEQTT